MEKEKEKEEKSLLSNQKREQIKKLHSTNITKHDCARHYHPYFAKVKKEYKTMSELSKVTYPEYDRKRIGFILASSSLGFFPLGFVFL